MFKERASRCREEIFGMKMIMTKMINKDYDDDDDDDYDDDDDDDDDYQYDYIHDD